MINENGLVNKVVLYECEYCEELHKTVEQAIECLNNHNIVFRIEQLKASHDCWGSRTSYWSSTDKLFKDYRDAVKYIGRSDDYRIVYQKLS